VPAPTHQGFWVRTVAFAIDAFILVAAIMLIELAVTAVSRTAGEVLAYVWMVLGIAAYYIYFWSEKSPWPGQTVGMKALKLRVVRSDGRPVSIATGLIRYVALLVCFLFAGLGVLWVAFDGKKQGWHDKAAGTFVVKS
jgi:uncharacterized RDD family membrane protein YckC